MICSDLREVIFTGPKIEIVPQSPTTVLYPIWRQRLGVARAGAL